MNAIYRQRALTVLMPLLILAGCSHTIPPTATTPQPPPQLGKTPPVIQPLSTAGKQAQAPESLLPITLTADLSPVQRIIQSALPDRITDERHPLSSDYRWRFVREGEPEVLIQDGLVKYHATYRGEIESNAARACRLDPVYPVLEGTGRLVLRPQDDGLLVTMADPQTSINVKPESDSKCNMFNLPVKEQLAELFRQEALTQQVVQSVEQAGYSIPINVVWDQLQNPVQVGSASNQLCLYNHVGDLAIGSMKGPAQQTTITGVARQAPVALFQTPCQKPKDAAPMNVRFDNAAAAAQEGQPYKMLLTVPVPYAVVNQQLQERLFHQELKLPTTFGSTLSIERATASDVNGRTLIAVDTTGDINGTLYYWGTPQLGQDGNVITIPDLQMANETKTALDDVKSGYWQMVDQELKDRLRQAATINLSQRVASMKSALSGQHKSGGMATDLLLARQQAGQVISTKDAIVADVLLEGTGSAMGRFPMRQQASREATDRSTIERTPERTPDRMPDRTPAGLSPQSARGMDDRPVDVFSGPR
jgi:hypothetical protein